MSCETNLCNPLDDFFEGHLHASDGQEVAGAVVQAFVLDGEAGHANWDWNLFQSSQVFHFDWQSIMKDVASSRSALAVYV